MTAILGRTEMGSDRPGRKVNLVTGAKNVDHAFDALFRKPRANGSE